MTTEPTKSELEVLQILWEHKSATVRVVHDILKTERDISYTATLKLMQLMHEKGLLERDESNMKHVYTASGKENEVKAGILNSFIDRVFKGSADSLVMQLLGNQKINAKKAAAIARLLKESNLK